LCWLTAAADKGSVNWTEFIAMELQRNLLLVGLGKLAIAREWLLGNRYKAGGYRFSFGMGFFPVSKQRKKSLGEKLRESY